jgi:hypothetical protein
MHIFKHAVRKTGRHGAIQAFALKIACRRALRGCLQVEWKRIPITKVDCYRIALTIPHAVHSEKIALLCGNPSTRANNQQNWFSKVF